MTIGTHYTLMSSHLQVIWHHTCRPYLERADDGINTRGIPAEGSPPEHSVGQLLELSIVICVVYHKAEQHTLQDLLYGCRPLVVLQANVGPNWTLWHLTKVLLVVPQSLLKGSHQGAKRLKLIGPGGLEPTKLVLTVLDAGIQGTYPPPTMRHTLDVSIVVYQCSQDTAIHLAGGCLTGHCYTPSWRVPHWLSWMSSLLLARACSNCRRSLAAVFIRSSTFFISSLGRFGRFWRDGRDVKKFITELL